MKVSIADWNLIHDARNYADANSTEDTWNDVVDTYIEQHAANRRVADASIEANNIALARRAGII